MLQKLFSILLSIGFTLSVMAGISADELLPSDLQSPDEQNTDQNRWTELAESIRPAIVSVIHRGRDGAELGMGTGFVIDGSGLIATSLHVLGEARPIEVRFENREVIPVQSVLAHDRSVDLAILKIDPAQLKNKFPAGLKLSTDSKQKQGASVAAMGHPRGYRHTLVTGLLSGYQEIEGQELLQVSMPIDHGNSGGPLLNQQGEVIGIITYKSSTVANVGFAMPASQLRTLWEQPNPVQMNRWVTIGKFNPLLWSEQGGADWKQRSGQFQVTGQGRGFGGRSLLIYQQPPAKSDRYELQVEVKLDDEAGAAGLIFQADGEDRHYGFYPSADKLRFSRFDGPDVFRWQVLAEKGSPSYRTGEWNKLRVEIQGTQFRCFCNDVLVFDLQDVTYTSGLGGLAKFRDTQASFRRFVMAEQLPSHRLDVEAGKVFREYLTATKTSELMHPDSLEKLSKLPTAVQAELAEEARQLEWRAQQLKLISVRLQEEQTIQKIKAELDNKEPRVERLGLLLAEFDNPEIDSTPYLEILRQYQQQLQELMPAQADPAQKIETLHRFLFEEYGFHGSRTQYYHKSNSYLTDVLDDREGLPITLSVLYITLAKQIGLDIRGIGLPGHFVVCHFIDDQPDQYIDVFDRGREIPRSEIQRMELAARIQGAELPTSPQSPRQILTRMIRNLKGIAESEENYADLLRYQHLLVAVDPESATEHRYLRALLLIRAGSSAAAWQDIEWLEKHAAPEIDAEILHELRQFAERRLEN